MVKNNKAEMFLTRLNSIAPNISYHLLYRLNIVSDRKLPFLINSISSNIDYIRRGDLEGTHLIITILVYHLFAKQ